MVWVWQNRFSDNVHVRRRTLVESCYYCSLRVLISQLCVRTTFYTGRSRRVRVVVRLGPSGYL